MIALIIRWWLASSLLGLIALPITWKLFSRLKDRGYGFSRAFGLLSVGYLLWAGASLGFLENNLGGVLASLLVVLSLSIYIGRDNLEEIRTWIAANRETVLVYEGIFLIAFMIWAFVRANNPEILHTEKPMELAFLNAILSSKRFPPGDPWLSGYAISYYYFGYVLLSFLTTLTGAAASVAFNVGNALWFALSFIGVYSILFNMLGVRKGKPRYAAPLLGPIFVLVASNLEILLDLFHHRHFFWEKAWEGALTSKFWTWLNIGRLAEPPTAAPTWIPDRYLWWWQASRIIQDTNLAGRSIEIIDEFPFFSFLLADNHPHLLALPFVLLAIGFALQIFLLKPSGSFRLTTRWTGHLEPQRLWKAFAVILLAILFFKGGFDLAKGLPFNEVARSCLRLLIPASLSVALTGFFLAILFGWLQIAVPKVIFWPAAWLFGGLAFLNTWDFPIYLSLLLGVVLWSQREALNFGMIKRIGVTALGLIITAFLFYLPWYPTFSSQASGILPNLIFPTRFSHYLIFWLPMLVPLIVWLWRAVLQQWKGRDWRTLVGIGLGLPLGLMILSWLLGAVVFVALQADPSQLQSVLEGLGATGPEVIDPVGMVIKGALTRRLTGSWSAILTGFIFALALIFLIRRREIPQDSSTPDPKAFVGILIMIGALLVVGPEFLYLRDVFGNRMNTVFKFYFAAWILWGLAAAYATVNCWPKSFSMKGLLRAFIVVPLSVSLLYAPLAIWTRTIGFQPPEGRTLDGMAYLAGRHPEEYQAIGWINEHLQTGIIVEAVGGSYSEFGRISTHTGLSTVIEWQGHEFQWRGSFAEQGTRATDVERLYKTRDWREARSIIQQYGIDYVYIGRLERNTYQPLDERKFRTFMDLIYENSQVMVFAAQHGEPVQ